MKLTAQSILAVQPKPHQVAVWYLGQVGFLLYLAGSYLLIDPYLTDSVDRVDPRFVRRYAPPITADQLDFVDVVLCTHDHLDHADPETLALLAKHNHKARFVVSAAYTAHLPDYQVPADRVVGVRSDTTIALTDAINLLAIPSAHEVREQDATGCDYHLGFVFQTVDLTLYHAGDCCMYDGLIQRLPPLDIAFLPINGRDYFRTSSDILGNMDSREALILAQKVGTDLLVPTHYDLYPDFNGADPAHFMAQRSLFAPTQAVHLFDAGACLCYPD